MSNFKDLVKNGWHPEKEGTTLKGQVSSLMGRSSSSSSSGRAADHVSRPLSDLRDPSAFAPPPRRTASAVAPPPARPEPPSSAGQSPDVAQPTRPYRADTTGLRTDHLPPPPARSPAAEHGAGAAVRPAPPDLPPRLPPRGAANAIPPPDGFLNQGAVARLGSAGVSVPALGIRRASPAAASPPPPRSAVGKEGNSSSRLDELQGKFAALGTPSGSSAPPPPSQGSTWAQKQAAVQTASAFRKDPSSVSLSDAKAAAGTANNFRQRHGDQVRAGVGRAHKLNQKYAVMDKVGAYVDRGSRSQAGHATSKDSASAATGPDLPGKKKPPPPPPPKKKPGVGRSNQSPADGRTESGAPPPIPMTTRPAF